MRLRTNSEVRSANHVAIMCVLIFAACTASETDTADPRADFWSSLTALCGQAFAGRVVDSNPPDSTLDSEPLVMHVRQCGETELRIPFHIGDNRSRTWVLTRQDDGSLQLKHDHRHEDGTEDELTQYGGMTETAGTSQVQEFAADAFTAELVPAAATNIWTIEVTDAQFVYALRRTDGDRRFRAEFDLSEAVEEPPPPWGVEVVPGG